MPDVIAYDVLRLFIGPVSLTPRGIDRVDIALARGIFVHPDVRHVGILPTPLGTFVLSGRQVFRLIEYLDAHWEAGGDVEGPIGDDLHLQRLVAVFKGGPGVAGPPAALEPPAPLSMRQKTYRMLHMVAKTGCFPRQLAARGVPRDARYLNVGQIGLAMRGFFKWLDKRPDVASAMMIHDAIPILHPDLVGQRSPAYHRQMIKTAATRADGLIFNSAYTRDSVSCVIRDMGYACPPAFVRSLPLPAAFQQIETSPPVFMNTRYLVAVSTIEPRKNYELLLRVWQRLGDAGVPPPHLVIVGSAGRLANDILKPLSTDPVLALFVHPVAGLSSRALAALMLGATGVLCPSLVEGFGLPLLEAIAMGVPAIASDIPAHRELANAETQLLPATDDAAWARAVAALPDVSIRYRPAVSPTLTESAYCADIVSFINGLSGRPFVNKA